MPSVVADIFAPQEVNGYPVHLFGGVDYAASVLGADPLFKFKVLFKTLIS
jgi:hypothetical protein